MSLTTDDGYMISPNKRSLALVTIPGQQARPRNAALEQLFAPERYIHGLVFVASYGYDHVWPGYTDLVSDNLVRQGGTYDLDALRKRNLMYESKNFHDICERMKQKRFSSPEQYWPKWLLILVNKADLYWDDKGAAERYYHVASEFADTTRDMVGVLGTGSIRVHILPVATMSNKYRFRSARGEISAATVLNARQCDASVRCLVDNLGELCDA